MKVIYVTNSIRLRLNKDNESCLVTCEQLICAPPIIRKKLTVKQNILRAFCCCGFGLDNGLLKSIPAMDAAYVVGESDGIAAGLLWSLAHEKYSPKAEDTSFSV